MHNSFIFKQLILSLFLFSVSKLGDILAELKQIKQDLVLRCFADNVTHILIGIISWLLVVSYNKLTMTHVFQSLVCGLFAGLIDIDHFLIAETFSFKDAVNLPSRPPFHNTTLMVSSSVFFIVLMHQVGHELCQRIGWFFLVAVVSHHLRDAMRRGLWIWPRVTLPLTFYECLIITYLFSLAVGSLLKIIDHPSLGEKNIPVLEV